ncbi:MAG TPA: F0F1 ATP synthase subunit A [Thermoleophilaceae bacterium]|nr:F0F1 ATP synthase subunit A [Thermoleophilaceae bacterium]
MRTRTKVFIGLGLWLLLAVVFGVLFGSEGRNEAFQPQEEFRLQPWIELNVLGIDMSINKAVMYLFLAAAATTATMVFIARRMQARPNRVQTAIEVAYDLTRNNITGQNMGRPMATKWFSFVATLFFFIWFSNMLGYLPLPTNTEHPVNIFGAEVPALAIYAATANLSIPLALTLVVWIAYHIEGIRVKGFVGFMKSFVPPGMSGVGAIPLFVIEVISDIVRIISLSVRLFANILAGHLLILFMAGGLVVLLGISALGVITLGMAIPFFLFEIGLVATLQAFIFAILTSIYLGGATADSH